MPNWYSDLRRAVNATFNNNTILSAAQCLRVTYLTLDHILREMPNRTDDDKIRRGAFLVFMEHIDAARVEAVNAEQ